MARARVVVIGAGFAGVNLVKVLRNAPVEITVLDRHNYHLFQPLLYQVASAAISPADIAYPIRRIFRRQNNVHVVLAEAQQIDLANKRVRGRGADGRDMAVGFDYLAICVGVTHSYFGNEAWRDPAPGLKTLDDATHIRRRILLAFEQAEMEKDEAAREATLTFVVVGGGPTGVELAGALREIAARDIQRDFRKIDTATARVILFEGSQRLLEQFPPELSERARKDLVEMGVEVRLGQRVTGIEPGKVVAGGETIAVGNVIWAAGVEAPKMLTSLGAELDRAGRVIVGPDLSVPGQPNVFVLGDSASAKDARTGLTIPGLAPAAIQMGKFVGRTIRDEVAGRAPKSRPGFSYRDKGIMATIGTHRGIASIRGLRFGGVLAWLAWSLVHIMFLISFRNRLFVMLGWMYDYVARGREACLITGAEKMPPTSPVETE